MKSIFILFLLVFNVIGGFSQTIWDGTTWDNGIPNIAIEATINGVYNTADHGAFSCSNLNVTINGDLTISESTTIQVQLNVTNQGTFTIEDKGSLIMIDPAGNALGNIAVLRKTPDYPTTDINSFYSSPIIEADSNMASIFNNDDIVYYWDTTNSPTFWIGPMDKSTTSFLLGKGYAARPDNTSGVITRSYTGQINTGDIVVPVNYSDSSTSPGQFGYNIIGNPYPSAIDWFAFKEDNASLLSGTMYYWRQLENGTTNYASDYVALNYLGVVPYNAATEFIGTAQGFVAKTNTTGNVVFKNSQRVANSNGQFFRNQSRMTTVNNSWFNLEGVSETSTILIGFNSNATTTFDDDYDGIFIGGTDPLQLYSIMGLEKLLINGQPELVAPNNVAIPLGIVTSSSGNYTISIDQEFISTDYFIKLEDTQENITTDLRLTDYTFSVSTPGENNSRFIMHYEYDMSLSVDEQSIIDENSVKAFFVGEALNIIIEGDLNPKKIELYEINGKLIYRNAHQNKLLIPNLSSGVYIIKTSFDENNSISKSILKQ